MSKYWVVDVFGDYDFHIEKSFNSLAEAEDFARKYDGISNTEIFISCPKRG